MNEHIHIFNQTVEHLDTNCNLVELDLIKNQLFYENNSNKNNNVNKIFHDKNEKLLNKNSFDLQNYELSKPIKYRAQNTPAWIVTICTEIWDRLLKLKCKMNCNQQYEISGFDFINCLQNYRTKYDRLIHSGIGQLLLDEKAIRQVKNKLMNNDNLNEFEFYDRKDVYYTCSCLNQNRLSIKEAVNSLSLYISDNLSNVSSNNSNNNNTDLSNITINHNGININMDNIIPLDPIQMNELGHEIEDSSLSTSTPSTNCHQQHEQEQKYPHSQNSLQSKHSEEIEFEHLDLDDANSIEDGFQLLIDRIYSIAPEVLFRKILQKTPNTRNEQELSFLYQELLLVPSLAQLSMSVRQELCKCLQYEVHPSSGKVVFCQGDPPTSWYIIYRGSVWVHVDGEGYVCCLSEGDDFGKLALITDASRAATIILAEDNCHFLRVDKNDFNRILLNVEANKIRLKKNKSDVLILEHIGSEKQLLPASQQTPLQQQQQPHQSTQLHNVHQNQISHHPHRQQSQSQHHQAQELKSDHNSDSNLLEIGDKKLLNYTIIAGTVEHIIQHLLENRLTNLENKLKSIIDENLFNTHLYSHTLNELDQIWEIFFLTYNLFTTNENILICLQDYLNCDNKSHIHITNTHSLNLTSNQSECNITIDTNRMTKVIIFFYIWRHCIGLATFGQLDCVSNFLMNYKNLLEQNYDKSCQLYCLHIKAINSLIDNNNKLMTNYLNSNEKCSFSNFITHHHYHTLRHNLSHTLHTLGNLKKCTKKSIITEQISNQTGTVIINPSTTVTTPTILPTTSLLNTNTTTTTTITTTTTTTPTTTTNNTTTTNVHHHNNNKLTTKQYSFSSDKLNVNNLNDSNMNDNQLNSLTTQQIYTNLLIGYKIIPPKLPLIKGVHLIMLNIYICDLQKYCEITIPIEINVKDLKLLLINLNNLKYNLNELCILEMSSKGDWNLFSDYDTGIMFNLSPNNRLFLCCENKLQSLIPLADQLLVTMNYIELIEQERTNKLIHDKTYKNFYNINSIPISNHSTLPTTINTISSNTNNTTNVTINTTMNNDLLLLKKSKPLIKYPVKLLDELSIDELATIFTCIHVKLALCITPQELLEFIMTGEEMKQITPHICILVKHFSLLNTWTITQIITTCNINKRVLLIKKFIKLAYQLISSPLYNLFGCLAIVLGLQNSSITRLTHTWERVSNRWKRLLTNQLIPLIDPAKNHRNIRLWYTHNINLSFIPFLALILKDLRFAEDANQTILSQSENNQIKLINFDKMRLISRSLKLWINAIKDYEYLHPYNNDNQFINIDRINNSLIMNVSLQKLCEISLDSQIYVLEHLDCIDDPKVITQLSLRIEPKK